MSHDYLGSEYALMREAQALRAAFIRECFARLFRRSEKADRVPHGTAGHAA